LEASKSHFNVAQPSATHFPSPQKMVFPKSLFRNPTATNIATLFCAKVIDQFQGDQRRGIETVLKIDPAGDLWLSECDDQVFKNDVYRYFPRNPLLSSLSFFAVPLPHHPIV